MSRKRILTAVVAMLTLAALCFSMVACTDNTDSGQSTEQNAASTETILAGGMQIGESQDYGIKLMSATLTASDYAAYGVSATAETAITVNATISPADAANQGVDWAIAWTNPSSTWASGKNVSDYVTLTASGKSATVACLQPFGQQITLTAKSQDNAEIGASCTLEYAQKVTAATLNIGNIAVNIGGNTSVKYEIAPGVTGPGGVISCNVTTNDVYTIAEAFTKTVTFDFDTDTNNWFRVNGSFPTGMAVADNDVTNWFGKTLYFDYDHDIYNWFIMARSGDIYFKNMTTSEVESYFANITSPNIATITFTLTGAHNTYTYTSKLVCTGYTNNTPVNALNLDTVNYVF